jgi:hypothetical protein
MRRRKIRQGCATVWASELAEMGACERRVLFAARYGRRLSAAQAAAARRGVLAHAQFRRDAGPSGADVAPQAAGCLFRFLSVAIGALIKPFNWLALLMRHGARRP